MTIANLEQHPAPDMGAFDETDTKVLDYLGLNPNNPASRAVVLVCRAYDLDAVLKHVIVIPKGGVYITRDGLLHIAHRSGQLDGIVVEQEPTLDGNEWVARVSVYRKDMRHPFTFPGRYPVNGSNRQYAPEMALKAAEAHALRRAFAVTGLPTEDEQRPEFAPTSGLGAHLPQSSGPEADPGASTPVEPTATSGPDVTPAQIKTIGMLMGKLSLTRREDALAYVADVIGHPVDSRNDLTRDEASAVIDALQADLTDAPVDAEIVPEQPAGESA